MKELRPPWVEFPNYEDGCMGWRMGTGDGYIKEWHDFIRELPVSKLKEYFERHCK